MVGSGFWLVVELAVIFVGGDEDFGGFVDVGLDAREIGDFGFWWLVVPNIVGLTDVFGRDVGIVG